MNRDFFSANRQALLNRLGGGALVILSAYGEMQQANDNAAPFTQEGNFWYLTGIEHPGWWVVLDGLHGAEWLVAPDLSESQKIFDGTADGEQLSTSSGIKTILSRDEALRRLRELAKRHSIAYTTEQPQYIREHASFQLNNAQAELKKVLDRIFQTVQICNKDVATLRTIKGPAEIKAIEKAIKITSQGILSLQSKLPTAKYEFELEAELSYAFRKQGAMHAYEPIVASGKNACTLHYVASSGRLNKKDLLLIDVGARADGYAADISRTFSLNRPTKRQETLHHEVLHAQQKIIELMKPGVSFQEYETQVEKYMKQAIEAVGLSPQRYRDYFPHAIGHGLGRDVHDPLAGYETFTPGMVITVEPGIYVAEEGIGIRIEDDIVITETGHTNLSRAISTAIS